MSLFDAIFGAKPAFGAPPFAGAHPQTGGAQMPTTPETLPVKRGFSGFIDRALNPTNALGQFGQALVASGGGPLGDAMAYMMKARQLREAQQQKGPHFEHVGDSFGVVDDTTGQFTPTYTAPKADPQPDDFTRQMIAAGIDPASDEGKKLFRQHVESIADPISQVPLGNGAFATVPRSMMGQIPGMQSFGGPVDPAPADAPPAGGVAPAPGGLAPRGIRNRNFLNLTVSPWTKGQAGFTGTDSGGRYATFDTPEHGIQAGANLLHSYIARGFDTPAEIIQRWAPKRENGASTQNYINAVSQRLGIDPNAPVPADRVGDLEAAMSDFENGRTGTIGVSASNSSPGVGYGAPMRITRDQYAALPSGTMFIAADDPTQTPRRKP